MWALCLIGTCVLFCMIPEVAEPIVSRVSSITRPLLAGMFSIQMLIQITLLDPVESINDDDYYPDPEEVRPLEKKSSTFTHRDLPREYNPEDRHSLA